MPGMAVLSAYELTNDVLKNVFVPVELVERKTLYDVAPREVFQVSWILSL
jgi:hypothetical protein